MITIETTTEIAAPPEVCFDLSLDVDEHAASTAHTGERVVAGVVHGKMGLGDAVTFEGRHFGVRFRHTSKITAYSRPDRFVDEMTEGPFRSVWHEHRFERVPTGTRMTETFKVAAPLGPLGLLAEALFLNRYLRRLLERRNAHIKSVAERVAKA